MASPRPTARLCCALQFSNDTGTSMHQSVHRVFSQLHSGPEPLLLANIWDAGSARFCQSAGARALGTSSAAMAWSLGYPDGSTLPRLELLGSVERIMRVAHVPITVDIEDGYSRDPGEVAELALALVRRGVAGINLEDGAESPDLLSRKISAIRETLAEQTLFINARTDVYLRDLAHGDAAPALAIERLHAYQHAGANGGFVPGLSTVNDAARVATQVTMPLNLMALPGMAVQELFAAGVRRLSAGPAPFLCAYSAAADAARQFHRSGEAKDLFSHGCDPKVLNNAFAGASPPQEMTTESQ